MFARFIDASRVRAAMLVALGLAIPLGFVFSGAAVAMTTLRRGAVEGAIVGLIGFGVIAALMLALAGGLDRALVAMLMLLGGIVATAEVLRQTSSLGVTVLTGIGLALSALLSFWILVADPVAFFRDGFVAVLDQLQASGAQLDPQQVAALVDAMQWRGAAGNVFGTLLVVALGSVFLGRSWQAQLVNPGGFQQEFHRLRLGKTVAMATAASFMAAAFAQWDLVLNLAAVMLYVWIIQGFAVIHGVVGVLNAGTGWLVAAYFLCIMGWIGANSLVLLVPLLGLINEFFDLREFLARKKGGE